jgi:hypothetical protein
MTPGVRLGLSVAAGIVGGIIAVLIWSRPPIYLGLIVGAVIGAIAFLAGERYLAGPVATGRPDAAAEPVLGRPGYEAQQPDPAGAAPFDAAAEGQARWGQRAPSARGRTGSGRRPARPVESGPSPDLARFVRQERLQAPVRLPQCPRCGSFEVDPAAAGGVYTFTCRACEHTWRWAPGEPWSRVVVDPRIRVPRYRDYPEGEEANHA